MNGTALEETAHSYYQNNEEELRDHLLATLVYKSQIKDNRYLS